MTSQRPGWVAKFSVAIRACLRAVRDEPSFWVHLPVATAVLVVAGWLQIEPWRWAVLVIAITSVLTAEMFNTAIEQLVKALHPEHDQRIGQALDSAAAAVLLASIGAVVVGLITLAMPLWDKLFS